MAVNAVRLLRKRWLGQHAFHDGQRSSVSKLDVALSAALALVTLVASAYEWWRAR